MRSHHYRLTIDWKGNLGSGTSGYRAYSRAMDIGKEGAPLIAASSDPSFRGDASRYNPEELLVASISGCHMLWYLHLCADAGVVVTDYRDEAEGTMTENSDGGGRFDEVILHPAVTLASPDDEARARVLHARAHERCFIANSVTFPVRVDATFR
ncbi:MAG: OsmC family protein [Gemmatimonadaceae bacterium]